MAPLFFYFARFSWCNPLTGALFWLKVLLSGDSIGVRYSKAFEKLEGQENRRTLERAVSEWPLHKKKKEKKKKMTSTRS